MIVPGSANAMLLATGSAALTTRSFRLNGISSYIHRLFLAEGDRRTFTIAFWFRRGLLGGTQVLLATPIVAGVSEQFLALVNDQLVLGTTAAVQVKASATFKDNGDWYHGVLIIDTTQAIASSRVRLWVNNSPQQITVNTLTLNQQLYFNQAAEHSIGRYAAINSGYFDGGLAEYYLVSGLALTPDKFGAQKTKWEPKKYGGAVGTTGFYLPFSSDLAVAASGKHGMFDDYSAQKNHFTAVSVFRAKGYRECWMKDHPMDVYPILDSNQSAAAFEQALVRSNGNLDFTAGATATNATHTQGVTRLVTGGKQYFELTTRSVGVFNSVGYPRVGLYDQITGNVALWLPTANPSAGWVYGLAIDYDAGKIWIRNGVETWTSGDPEQGTSPSYTFTPKASGYKVVVLAYNNYAGSLNFGQREFEWQAPKKFGLGTLDLIPAPVTYPLTLVISVNTLNFNLRAAAVAAGWNQVLPLDARVTVNAGVIVGSSSLVSGFVTGTDYPAGSILSLTNNGTIKGIDGTAGAYGAGGAGAPAANSYSTPSNGGAGGAGGSGSAGGLAMQVSYPMSVMNNGVITGGAGGAGGLGGGGGGGAGASRSASYVNGSGTNYGVTVAGGNGGAGQGPGAPVAGTAGQHTAGQYYNTYIDITGSSGGNGGAYGQPGGNGGGWLGYTGRGSASAGGAAGANGATGANGAAVVGDANITWIVRGTVTGTVS